MKAEQMFEEIGYKLSEAYSEDTLISYFDGKKNITIEFCIKNKKFRKAKGVFDCVNISIPELKAIQKQCKELGWLEEEKAETNYEHFKDEIVQNVKYKLAVVNGEPKPCEDTNCDECDFNNCDCCGEKRFEWLASPYKKPTYKLSRFEYDLIQTYRDCNNDCKLSDRRILRELKDKGYFMDVDYDTKIQDILGNCEVINDGYC
jgi:hypothetical protein